VTGGTSRRPATGSRGASAASRRAALGRRTPGPARERGIGLVEVLVAITVLALAITISLVLYDGARRSFQVGTNLAEQQQVVRIAFDKLSRDLALAGLNSNPDGTQNRPDEALEAAFDTAIVIRADFDAGDPARSVDPELLLAGQFHAVSTGNDEIVGYVLSRPGRSSETLSFEADVVGVPRDGVVETVTVPDISLLQDDPPYTLYRITVDDDQDTSRMVPLIDNVRSLRFVYYDRAGNVLPAPGGADDAASRRARASIQRIGVRIEGLTSDADLRWEDPTDSDSETREYRKFALVADVTPTNLGLFGLKDLDASLAPPSEPPPPTLHPGHCRALWVDWAPNPPQDEVARYEVRYGQNPADLDGPDYAAAPGFYLDGLEDGKKYYVTIEAVDDSGNVSPPSAPASAYAANLNTPERPQNLSATTALAMRVELSWEPVVDNVVPSAPGADPLQPRLRDFAAYHVHRASMPGYSPDASNRIAETTLPQHADTAVVHCKPYHYKVVAIDDCAKPGAEAGPIEGRAYTTVEPEKPINVQAFPVPGGIRVIWDSVTLDVAGSPIHIEDYTVLRASVVGGIPPPDSAYAPIEFVSGATEYVDPTAYDPLAPVSYKLQARDLCPNESELSDAAEPVCQFVGDVVIVQPQPGDVSVGNPVQVVLQNGSGSYQLTLDYIETDGDLTLYTEPLGSGTTWATAWPTQAGAPGSYRMQATAQQADGCVQQRSVSVSVGYDGADSAD